MRCKTRQGPGAMMFAVSGSAGACESVTPIDRCLSLEGPHPYRLIFKLSSRSSRNQSIGEMNGFSWQFIVLFREFFKFPLGL
jgi:hypothetical protein